MIFKDYNLVYPDRIEKGTLWVDHGIIHRINNDEIPAGEAVRDGAFGLYLSPGFIDIHLHGAGGADTMEATFEALNTISTTICQYGTTSFLPTTMTQSTDRIRQAVRAIKDHSFWSRGLRSSASTWKVPSSTALPWGPRIPLLLLSQPLPLFRPWWARMRTSSPR